MLVLSGLYSESCWNGVSIHCLVFLLQFSDSIRLVLLKKGEKITVIGLLVEFRFPLLVSQL